MNINGEWKRKGNNHWRIIEQEGRFFKVRSQEGGNSFCYGEIDGDLIFMNYPGDVTQARGRI